MVWNQTVQDAHNKAVEALKNSYAPYSKLHVGASLKLKGQNQFVMGVNVENASYGATICAERSALVSAQSQFGKFEIEFILVISDISGGSIPPCGMCLQVLIEFTGGETPVYLGNDKEVVSEHQLKDFLPLAFSKEMLP